MRMRREHVWCLVMTFVVTSLLAPAAVPARAEGQGGARPPAAPSAPTFAPEQCPDVAPAPTGEAPAAAVARSLAAGRSPHLAAALTSAAPAPAEQPGDTGVPGGVRCGTVRVPLEHDDPAAATIELFAAVIPAVEPTPDAEPLLVLGGGPGEHMVAPLLSYFATPESPAASLHQARDVILLDQRGVGSSRPALECPELDAALHVVDPADDPVEELAPPLRACRDRLVGEGVDLSAFDTANNLRDLDLVRRALGYERVHLFGTSYGARLAWQAARLFPEHLASLVLESPIPASQNWVVDLPRSLSDAVDATLAACADDPECAAAHPDSAATLDRVLERYRTEPGEITVPHALTGEPHPITVDEEAIALALLTMYYLPPGPSLVPSLLVQLEMGNLEVLVPLLARAPVGFSFGMAYSSMCAEEARYVDHGELAGNLVRSGELGRAAWRETMPAGRSLWPLCREWPVEKASPQSFTPFTTDVPTLVVTGQFDQVTPPVYGRIVARAARNSQYVEVAGSGHAPVYGTPCGFDVVAAFLDDPGAPVDTGCLPSEPVFLDRTDAEGTSPGGDDS